MCGREGSQGRSSLWYTASIPLYTNYRKKMMMDFKTFVLLNGSRIGPVWTGFETPTLRSNQIMHCRDISQQACAEFPAQKVRHGNLTPARSRIQRELVILVRLCGMKVGKDGMHCLYNWSASCGECMFWICRRGQRFPSWYHSEMSLRFTFKVYLCLLPPYWRHGGSHPRLLRTQGERSQQVIWSPR